MLVSLIKWYLATYFQNEKSMKGFLLKNYKILWELKKKDNIVIRSEKCVFYDQLVSS